ncbi:hypothetical protein M0802_002851 [Mischocyttarus mexicanus]|nr:hypothetical protein M0802_002851 [Mischocyttarus mexicanus]
MSEHEIYHCNFPVTFGDVRKRCRGSVVSCFAIVFASGYIRMMIQQDQRGSRGISISPEPLALALPINEVD